MKLRLACSLLLLSVFAVTPVAFADTAAAASDGNPGISDNDKKIILEYVNKYQLDLGGVDAKTGEVRITNQDLNRAQAENETIASGGESVGKFTKNCELPAPPKVTFDMAVIKLSNAYGQTSGVFDGFSEACSNPPNAINKKFSQQIKVVHFKLGGVLCKPNAFGGGGEGAFTSLDFNRQTGVLDVGMAPDGCAGLAGAIQNWIRQQ